MAAKIRRTSGRGTGMAENTRLPTRMRTGTLVPVAASNAQPDTGGLEWVKTTIGPTGQSMKTRSDPNVLIRFQRLKKLLIPRAHLLAFHGFVVCHSRPRNWKFAAFMRFQYAFAEAPVPMPVSMTA